MVMLVYFVVICLRSVPDALPLTVSVQSCSCSQLKFRLSAGLHTVTSLKEKLNRSLNRTLSQILQKQSVSSEIHASFKHNFQQTVVDVHEHV